LQAFDFILHHGPFLGIVSSIAARDSVLFFEGSVGCMEVEECLLFGRSEVVGGADLVGEVCFEIVQGLELGLELGWVDDWIATAAVSVSAVGVVDRAAGGHDGDRDGLIFGFELILRGWNGMG